MRLVIGILITLAFGGLALEIGLKLGGATLALVVIVALGLIAHGFAIVQRSAKRDAKRTKNQDQT